ncbi:cysteine--tRNA ligase, partial [Patescibacteria group bacterium]|nr:cysteine--tRNA ligase [Patescibacteria group bacterium]
LALVWELVKADMPSSQKRATLREMDRVLGLGIATWQQEAQDIPEEIQRLAEERQQARAQKDWAASDRLRDALAAQGWVVRDTPSGFELTPLE